MFCSISFQKYEMYLHKNVDFSHIQQNDNTPQFLTKGMQNDFEMHFFRFT